MLAAVAAGTLDPARLASFRRLEREAAYAARQADESLARAEKLRWKKIHVQARAREALRGRGR